MNGLLQTLRRMPRGAYTIGAAILLPLLVPGLTSGADRADPHRVLYINSYHQGLSWADGVTAAIREGLAGESVDLQVEYLDSKRHSLEEVRGPFFKFLQDKYGAERMDAVIVSDNNALAFLRDHHAELFPGAPIVFCGINNFTPQMIEGFGPEITGVVEISDPYQTVKHVLRIVPGVKRLAVINGTTTTGRVVRDEAREALRPLEDRLAILWWDGLEAEELTRRLETLEPEDAVLLLLYNKDGAARYYSNKDAALLIDTHSPVPVFGLWDFYLGTGIIGGRLINAEDQGAAAVGLVKRILSGTPASGIPVIGTSPNRDIFDYDALLRRGLEDADLPVGATVLNRPDDRLGGYLAYLYAGLALIGGSALLIGLFVAVSVLPRKRSEAPRFAADVTRLVVATPILAVLFAFLLWAAQDYLHFRQDAGALRRNLMRQTMDGMAHEVDRSMEGIAFLRETERNRQREQLKERVDSAHRFARDLSGQYADRPGEEGASAVAAALAAFRWDEGAGYFFVFGEDGHCYVHAARPDLVGRNALDLTDADGRPIVRRMLEISEREGEGFLSYNWIHGEGTGSARRKLSYFRSFRPFRWMIGAGTYLTDMRVDEQSLVFRHLQSVSFSIGEGSLFILDREGVAVGGGWEPEGIGAEELREILAAADRPGGGFVTVGEKNDGKEEERRILYVRGVTDWGWVVGTAFPLAELERTIAEERRELLTGLATRLASIAGVLLFLGTIGLLLGRRFSRRLSREIADFGEGFAGAARGESGMDETAFPHAEIREMVRGINGVLEERALTRRALQSTQERLELAMDAADHGFWDYDVPTGVCYFSPRYYTMLGYEPGELPMRFETWVDLLHPEDRERAVAKVKEHVDAGRPYEIEFRLRTKEGGWCWISGRGKSYGRDEEGRPARAVGIHVDITERKEAEEKLLHSRERFKNLFEQSNDAIFIYNLMGDVLDANDRAAELLGLSREEILRKRVFEFQPEEDRPVGKGALEETERRGRATFESRYLSVGGSIIDVEISARLIDAEKGIVQGVVRDITERKRAEAEQKEFLAELERVNHHLEKQTGRANEMAARAEMASAAKSEFLARMSHEIRTPMNGVIGMTSLLADTVLTEEQRRYLETIRASGEALLTLINDILDFSKIEAGKMEIEETRFDLVALLDDLIGPMAVKAEEKDLAFVCAADPEVPAALLGDPGRLRQILLNLAGNAVKFTEEGEVAVRVGLGEESPSRAVLRFTVSDTGIGIPAEKQSRLFESFQQVDPSNTRKYGGTGLGLAISRSLIELMGGAIEMESEEGKGTVFRFHIPFAKQADGASPPASAGTVGKKILVAENHVGNRETILARLRAWGMAAEGAASASDALRQLREAASLGRPFDGAILDDRLPDMRGEALCRTILGDSRLPRLAIARMLSFSLVPDGETLRNCGFSSYLQKPVRRMDLLSCLESLFRSDEEREEPAGEEAAIGEKRAAGARGRILLVEDNEVNRQVATGILGKMGFSIDEAWNGREAIRVLEERDYDLVLMDVQMPEMDGLEATSRIRDRRGTVRNREIPVVAMTAHAMKGDREKCLAAGMDDYLTKPVRPDALEEVLGKWIGRRSGEPEETERDDAPLPEPSPPPSGTESSPPLSPPEEEARSGEPDEPAPSSPGGPAEGAGGPSPPVFDRESFLERVMNDEGIAKRILDCFLTETPALMEELEELIRGGDAEAAGRRAHGIKGSAANVGAEAMRAVAFAIEQAGKGEDGENMRRLLPDLASEFERFREVAPAAF